MSHTPHELAEEFPAEVEKMHRLKQDNAHFAKLFDEYHEVKSRKLKVFRLEAVRAGFKKAWGERDYETILAVAEFVDGMRKNSILDNLFQSLLKIINEIFFIFYTHT